MAHAQKLVSRRYVLLTPEADSGTGPVRAMEVGFMIGNHGDVVITGPQPAGTMEGNPVQSCADANARELFSAREELRTWESRVKLSPLGITQQDYLAFFQELVVRYETWFHETRIPIPQELPPAAGGG
jgi:hypothetical protein